VLRPWKEKKDIHYYGMCAKVERCGDSGDWHWEGLSLITSTNMSALTATLVSFPTGRLCGRLSSEAIAHLNCKGSWRS